MLEQLAKQYESKLKTFDPNDRTDLLHYMSLRYDGKQLERRYILEQPFPDVIAMMQHKIAQTFLVEKLQVNATQLNYG